MKIKTKIMYSIATTIIAIGFMVASSTITNPLTYVYALLGSCSDAPYLPSCDSPNGGTGGHSDPGPIHPILCNYHGHRYNIDDKKCESLLL